MRDWKEAPPINLSTNVHSGDIGATTTPEAEGIEEVNYQTIDCNGFKWIRYDHHEHALHHQLQKAREEERELVLNAVDVYTQIAQEPHINRNAVVEWVEKIRHDSELDQDVQVCIGYTKIGDKIYKQSELDQDVSK